MSGFCSACGVMNGAMHWSTCDIAFPPKRDAQGQPISAQRASGAAPGTRLADDTLGIKQRMREMGLNRDEPFSAPAPTPSPARARSALRSQFWNSFVRADTERARDGDVHALSTAFPWRDSLEGYGFWLELNEQRRPLNAEDRRKLQFYLDEYARL